MPSPGQKIFEANSEGLYDFVSKNGRGLYIPPYQRDYAWDKTNVERLIDDTIQGLNSLLKRPDESITFIGTIIAMNDAKKVTISPIIRNQIYGQVMTIIDGQQRLTTLLMLCLSMYVEIEEQWEKINRARFTGVEETKQWLEFKVNNMRGLLSQMLSERQNNGEGHFRYFPKMIRSFKDQWSYENDKAKYESPIAWLIFEFIKFKEDDGAEWSKFLSTISNSASSSDENLDTERKHFIRMVRVMKKKLSSLQDDDEFPDMSGIVADKNKQDILLQEELPENMRMGLEAALKSIKESAASDDQSQSSRLVNWWKSVADLVSLLCFCQFALDRITLVIVTATTEDFAFDVFEALNTTGQPLTAIETFTPKVVQSVGLANYDASNEKKQIEIAFNYVKKATKADERQKRSADLLVAFALAERGDRRSKNLADQRRFMRDTFEQCGSREKQQEFIRHLADLSKFFDTIWTSSSTKPKIEGHEIKEPAAICLNFLVDFGHTITAPLLAQYAARVSDLKTPEERVSAVDDFCQVVLGVTAFTILWRASRDGTDRIDHIYREFMSKGSPEHNVPPLARGLRNGSQLPRPDQIKQALFAKLTAERFNGGGNIKDKKDWLDKTIQQPMWEVNNLLARFFLFIAFNDTVEKDGRLVSGKPGSNPILNLESWTGEKYKSVEHIAPRSRKNGWSPELYENEEHERIGNLTLVPSRANSSLGDRPWNEKRVVYGALAAETSEQAKEILQELSQAGGSLTNNAEAIYSGEYLPHVHVLYKVQGEWNLNAVESRGRELAELVWDKMVVWLNKN